MIKDIRKICNLNVNKNPNRCKSMLIFTAKLLYMFRVSQHPSSGVLKTVPPASGTGHNTGTATPLRDGGSTVVKLLCYKSVGRWFDPS